MDGHRWKARARYDVKTGMPRARLPDLVFLVKEANQTALFKCVAQIKKSCSREVICVVQSWRSHAQSIAYHRAEGKKMGER
eukprot:1997915-Karenia_brevis.AAC.1